MWNNIYGDAFWATGNIGFYLLGMEIAKTSVLEEEEGENPMFR